MNVSTVASYTGAQVFEAVGLGQKSRRRVLLQDHLEAGRRRSRRPGPGSGAAHQGMPSPPAGAPPRARGGRRGSPASGAGRAYHLFNPETIYKLQLAPARVSYVFKEYLARR
ncbi:MAG: hypothetical protein R2701_11190 [Acidimicrobiales bacterium]